MEPGAFFQVRGHSERTASTRCANLHKVAGEVLGQRKDMWLKALDEKFPWCAENQAYLVESIAGIETIKAMAVEPQMQRRWEEELARYVGASFAASQVVGNWTTQAANPLSKPLADLLCSLAGSCDRQQAQVGELVAFNMLAAQAGAAAGTGLAGFPSSAVVGRAAWRHSQHARRAGGRKRAGRPCTDRRRDRVTFRYGPQSQPVLRELSLTIPRRQVVGIVGPSGSGKGTIAKLAQRLYLPSPR